MQSSPATAYLRNDNYNTKATSLPAAGMQTFAADAPMRGPFDIDLQAMKSVERIPSGIHAFHSGPTQQTMNPNANNQMKTHGPLPTGLSLRQESLEALASTELTRSKMNGGSQTLFADVLEQLSSKEESLPMQAALYRLPSMQFLESLLDEMDSRSASVGNPPAEPPLYLPLDSFDLPGLDSPGAQVQHLAQLGLPPLPRRVHSAHAGVGNALGHDQQAAIIRTRPPVPPFDMASQHNYLPMIPNAGSAAPSPQRGIPMPNRPGPAAMARQTAHALEELYGFEESEVSLQTSKSGRVRKVTSFAGAKRKLGDMTTQVSAPAALGGERYSDMQHTQDSDLTNGSDAGEEVDREFRKSAGGKKGKRTVCLNCGSHQTPQWRCGPLGPRTLCNACGVRYKKGLPLNCWPLREGLVLPPGAVLPSTVQVPAGINIITQPLDSE